MDKRCRKWTPAQQRVQDILEAAGGRPAVCKRLSIGRNALYRWVLDVKIPAQYVETLSEMTGGKYTPYQIRDAGGINDQ